MSGCHHRTPGRYVGVVDVATHVSRLDVSYAGKALKNRFDAPEASAAEKLLSALLAWTLDARGSRKFPCSIGPRPKPRRRPPIRAIAIVNGQGLVLPTAGEFFRRR